MPHRARVPRGIAGRSRRSRPLFREPLGRPRRADAGRRDGFQVPRVPRPGKPDRPPPPGYTNNLSSKALATAFISLDGDFLLATSPTRPMTSSGAAVPDAALLTILDFSKSMTAARPFRPARTFLRSRSLCLIPLACSQSSCPANVADDRGGSGARGDSGARRGS